MGQARDVGAAVDDPASAVRGSAQVQVDQRDPVRARAAEVEGQRGEVEGRRDEAQAVADNPRGAATARVESGVTAGVSERAPVDPSAAQARVDVATTTVADPAAAAKSRANVAVDEKIDVTVGTKPPDKK